MADLSLENRDVKDKRYSLEVLKHSIKFSLISFIAAIITLMIIIALLGGGPSVSGKDVDLAKTFTVRTLLVPLIETIIFQLLIITMLLKIKRLKIPIVITASAVIFCLSHSFSKLILIVPLGFVLAYVFCYWLKKTGTLKWAFTATYLTHVLHNFFSFLLNFFRYQCFFGCRNNEYQSV